MKSGNGILVIGAFHLRPAEIDLVEQATRRVLDARGKQKEHLAAVVIFSVSYELQESLIPANARPTLSFTPVLHTRLIRNDGYSGGMTIQS